MKPLVYLAVIILLSGCAGACTKKLSPPPPAVMTVPEVIERVPASEIDIPVSISLQPLYTLAESYVDREFSSEGWPDKWVYDGCNTRYMYHFRRGPLVITPRGNQADLDFTGYYKVKGSQRGCIAGVGITPWSPPCTCGVNEPERKIAIGFSASFSINPDYSIGSLISIKPIKPLDACEVCFFKTDITNTIISNIQPELDNAKKMVEQQLKGFQLRPRFEQLWAQLQQPIALPGYGYLHLQPELLRLSSLNANTNRLQLVLGLRARPLVSLEPPVSAAKPLPPLSGNFQPGGFNLYADARLRYDSLNLIINRQLSGTRIEMDKGPVKNKYVVIDRIALSARDGATLVVKATVSGSVSGTVYLTGKPVYDSASATLRFNELDFDIRSREFIVKTAAWLLDKKFTRMLRNAAAIDIKTYLEPLKTAVNKQLSRTLAPGITSTGQVQLAEISALVPQPDYLFVRVHASGAMRVDVTGFTF